LNLPKGVVTQCKYFRKLFRLWPKNKTNLTKLKLYLHGNRTSGVLKILIFV
jgi:hypothetical protein